MTRCYEINYENDETGFKSTLWTDYDVFLVYFAKLILNFKKTCPLFVAPEKYSKIQTRNKRANKNTIV